MAFFNSHLVEIKFVDKSKETNTKYSVSAFQHCTCLWCLGFFSVYLPTLCSLSCSSVYFATLRSISCSSSVYLPTLRHRPCVLIGRFPLKHAIFRLFFFPSYVLKEDLNLKSAPNIFFNVHLLSNRAKGPHFA